MSLEGEKEPEFVVSESVDSWNIPTKTFEYSLNGETIAVGTAKIISQPFPLVYVQGIDVSKEHMSEGYGSKLMDQMENLIYRNGTLGMLYSQILGAKSTKVHGMYERRGWNVVPGRSSLMYFNFKEGDDDSIQRLSEIYDQGIKPMYGIGERHGVWIA